MHRIRRHIIGYREGKRRQDGRGPSWWVKIIFWKQRALSEYLFLVILIIKIL